MKVQKISSIALKFLVPPLEDSEQMFAIVEACGRQYQLEAGRFVDLDLTDAEEGSSFLFEKVIMLVDGASSTLGAPFIDGAKVTGRVIKHYKGRKIIVYHQKPKKGTRKKQGHRQHFTRIAIDSIEFKDKVLAKAEKREPREPAAPKKEKVETKKVKAAEPKKAKTAEKPAKPKADKAKSEPKTKKAKN
jgi:large subunit ribosomal protein L21